MRHDLVVLVIFLLVVAGGGGILFIGLNILFLPAADAMFLGNIGGMPGFEPPVPRSGSDLVRAATGILIVPTVAVFMFGLLWLGSWLGKQVASKLAP